MQGLSARSVRKITPAAFFILFWGFFSSFLSCSYYYNVCACAAPGPGIYQVLYIKNSWPTFVFFFFDFSVQTQGYIIYVSD